MHCAIFLFFTVSVQRNNIITNMYQKRCVNICICCCYGNTIKSPLVIHDKTLFMHSDPRVRGRPILLSAVLPRGKASVCPEIIPEPSYDTDAEAE